MAACGAGRSELLNMLGDVKARVQDKLGLVDFPMPQFILIGKQSVGKSRLIEALAGEQFNFCSGTLGSRRPTVLEFRNTPSGSSQWFVRSRTSNQWVNYPIETVMKIVGDSHQDLGATVSADPVYVRVQSPSCVDMQIVDLPGFRDFAHDRARQDLSIEIEKLNATFMNDKRNVMLCVEQAGDSATMATLSKCRKVDPNFDRTILIRNKLDKYYRDLTCDNVAKWVEGYGDLPANLNRFALTLPWWTDDDECPGDFAQLRNEKSREDVREMEYRQLSSKHMQTIGFESFAAFMEKKIEQLFSEAVGPVLSCLRGLTGNAEKKLAELELEFTETDSQKMVRTMRECAALFAHALTPVMEGALALTAKRMTLEQELKEFAEYHKAIGSTHFSMLPSEDFTSLDDYISYLGSDIQVGAFDVEINGGAMYRRMISEVEIYLRFSDISENMSKRDVIQARGVSMGSVTWRDVVVKLLGHEAHAPLQRRVQYVGERIKWFFMVQKDAVIEFMDKLEGTPAANMYSKLFPKRARLIKQNSMIKQRIFDMYDKACQRQLQQFSELFENMLTSEFSNPWVFLKGDDASGDKLPSASFDDVKARVPKEIQSRSNIEMMLSKWLQDIPTDEHQMDVVVDKVQQLMLKTYSFIRSQVCDQVELFAESFFKLPMMRRLEEDMSMIELTEADTTNHEARRDRLANDIEKGQCNLKEVNACIDRLQAFALKEGQGARDAMDCFEAQVSVASCDLCMLEAQIPPLSNSQERN
eukprot:CAMPEP_0171099728 /NCGR_PEP_ID=MMETSP0766_2-20121228/52408_1 /TAXON_ID=439317 /ORGANISM="Gambierdiscus australes, Strain CAWD 149" /LENGTH=755 /DNA_ID=CAMNT_0011559421 /DNA_START=38 /DNA_END=2303 /DNA_ORIENTATION=+